MSCPGHSLVGCLTPLQICSWCILQPQPTGERRKTEFIWNCIYETLDWNIYIAVNRRTRTLAYKDISIFILLGVKASVVCKTDGRTDGDESRQLYRPITSSIEHITFCYLQGPLSTSASCPGSTQPETCCGHLTPVGHQATVWHFPWLTKSLLTTVRLTLSVSLMGTRIYHFITPTDSRSTTWLLPLIFPHASCAENLWWTARSRVNI